MDTQTRVPLILAFETSGETGGVAFYQERLLGEVVLSGAETYSRRLLPAIEFLCLHLGVSLEKVSALAVAIGPGSFTGLRIGLATVKGIALALKKPLVAINTLEALAALHLSSPYPVCPVLDARRGEIYTAIYRFQDGFLKTLLSPTVISLEGLAERIHEPTIFVGEGLRVYGDFLRKVLGQRFRESPGHLREGRAGAVAYLADQKIRQGLWADPHTLTPFYLRPSEAERKRGLPHA